MFHQRIVGVVATAVAAIVVASALYARDERGKLRAPRDVTLTGRIVDLQNFMTGTFASSDKVKCTRDCIRAGVPAALKTDDGVILLGEGVKGPQRTLAPLALRFVEVKGKLYERDGLRYIDMASVQVTKPETEVDESEPWNPDPVEPELDSTGACCLPNGSCVDATETDCSDSDGTFHAGLDCERVECE